MSRVVAERKYLFPTQLGNITVKGNLVKEYDVEDIVHSKGISQGRNLQFINLGRTVDPNARLPSQSIPAVFLNNNATLPEG